MTLAALTFLTLLCLTPVTGRYSSGNQGGEWQQQEVRGGGGGGEAERGERVGRKDVRENEIFPESASRDSDRGNGDGYGGARKLTTTRRVVMEVAGSVLRLLHQHREQERRMGRSSMASTVARDAIRLVVMGFMGYQGEEDCIKRVACETGGILARVYPSAPLILGAADLMAPPYLSRILRLVKDAAMGLSCVSFRCGDAYYPSENEVNH
ncbi:uncharacterized protein LOC126983534 [Eriocheir sinensis]|uniref:uncharacterized protein LOC126983534 n=1 Tax=Eriocheir sinensis TaxID=95602 RepID=UPI0021C96B2A|nr:uncharacterized protein LOC126983534 [Eriocheir sinensis]